MCLFRDWGVCWVLSIGFELLELSMGWLVPQVRHLVYDGSARASSGGGVRRRAWREALVVPSIPRFPFETCAARSLSFCDPAVREPLGGALAVLRLNM